MSFTAAVLLGIIQGLTEFLPVSSSAHLILARAFFGWELPPGFGLAFDVAVHVGTLAAIIVFFRVEILNMMRALPTVLNSNPEPSAKLIQLIVIGTIPVVIIAITFSDIIENVLRTPAVAAGALAFGAVLMLAAERVRSQNRTEDSIGWGEALLIGCAQAAALVPGMSRSGGTIALGMFLGIRRDASARFTFLLSIPAMLAAAAKEAIELSEMSLPAGSGTLLAIGVLVSAVTGYVTIKFFLRFLAGHKLDVFAAYRLLLAGATFAWLVSR